MPVATQPDLLVVAAVEREPLEPERQVAQMLMVDSLQMALVQTQPGVILPDSQPICWLVEAAGYQ